MRGHEKISALRMKGRHPSTIAFRIGKEWAKPCRPKTAIGELLARSEADPAHPTVYTGDSEPCDFDLRFAHRTTVLAYCHDDDMDRWQRWLGAITAADPLAIFAITDDGLVASFYHGPLAGKLVVTDSTGEVEPCN